MLFSVSLDVAAPGLIFLFGLLPILFGIAIVAAAAYFIIRTIKKNKK